MYYITKNIPSDTKILTFLYMSIITLNTIQGSKYILKTKEQSNGVFVMQLSFCFKKLWKL
jgi:hypothetical protein